MRSRTFAKSIHDTNDVNKEEDRLIAEKLERFRIEREEKMAERDRSERERKQKLKEMKERRKSSPAPIAKFLPSYAQKQPGDESDGAERIEPVDHRTNEQKEEELRVEEEKKRIEEEKKAERQRKISEERKRFKEFRKLNAQNKDGDDGDLVMLKSKSAGGATKPSLTVQTPTVSDEVSPDCVH